MNDFIIGFCMFVAFKIIIKLCLGVTIKKPEINDNSSKFAIFLHSFCVMIFNVTIVVILVLTLGLLNLNVKPRD
jgi:heme/copper-type cytochrome/quinol oxidase subunit 2